MFCYFSFLCPSNIYCLMGFNIIELCKFVGQCKSLKDSLVLQSRQQEPDFADWNFCTVVTSVLLDRFLIKLILFTVCSHIAWFYLLFNSFLQVILLTFVVSLLFSFVLSLSLTFVVCRTIQVLIIFGNVLIF